MTKDELRALGERAVKCKGWRRMPRMEGLDGTTLLQTGRETMDVCADLNENYIGVIGEWSDERWLPNLADHATLGCLLAQVREAWGRPDACATLSDPGVVNPPVWYVYGCPRKSPKVRECFATEAEALVAALEAAPGAPWARFGGADGAPGCGDAAVMTPPWKQEACSTCGQMAQAHAGSREK